MISKTKMLKNELNNLHKSILQLENKISKFKKLSKKLKQKSKRVK